MGKKSKRTRTRPGKSNHKVTTSLSDYKDPVSILAHEDEFIAEAERRFSITSNTSISDTKDVHIGDFCYERLSYAYIMTKDFTRAECQIPILMREPWIIKSLKTYSFTTSVLEGCQRLWTFITVSK